MISKSDYQKLCDTCDEILLSNKADNTILANTWLHILREHPIFLKNYVHLFGCANSTQLIKRRISNLVRFLSIAIIRILQSIFNNKYWHTAKDINQSDVLFVSHLTNEKLIGEDDDFYFHDLPSQLENKNISVAVALINHIKLSDSKKLKPWRDNAVKRLVLDNTLNLLAELKILFTQFNSVLRLKKIMLELNTSRLFRMQAYIQMISPETINALRISKQIALLASKTNTKYLVITYEGHAWERLVFYEARKVNPNIKCIGYQHAPIIKHQHASQRNLSPSYNPDIVLTSGKIGEQQFKDSNKIKDIDIRCLGSAKSGNFEIKNDINHNACLVIPEGLISECLILFEFSLFCASKMPKYKFIWRLHPLMSFKDLQDHSKIFESLPENICLSDKTLDFDVQRCGSVLYRGSTAVINAINGGLKPIYYKLNGEMSIDPIYQHHHGKYIVDCFLEFKNALMTPLTTQEQAALIDFCKNLYSPLNYSVFIELMKK